MKDIRIKSIDIFFALTLAILNTNLSFSHLLCRNRRRVK